MMVKKKLEISGEGESCGYLGGKGAKQEKRGGRETLGVWRKSKGTCVAKGINIQLCCLLLTMLPTRSVLWQPAHLNSTAALVMGVAGAVRTAF